MAGMIRRDDIDAVRERTDIVKVISGYLQLKKAGRDSLVGICPFHTEKTPSLSVSPAKQLYYCFGCGEAGDVFRFLQRMESLTFVEAMERLARDAGVSLRYEGQTASGRRAGDGRRQVLHKAIDEAGKLYHGVLVDGREGADARSYLTQRGVTRESVERFGIGYAPGYPDFLLKRLSKTYSAEILLEAGLVTKDGSGAVRDNFRGRVMFPIHDLSGTPIGFGGRLLAGSQTPNLPKYKNSRDSPLYHKSSLLYNLNRAKPEITRQGRAFLVEGYTDVIALDQAGVGTAVGTCGTALGEEHIRLLSRFADKAILAFDSDEAGARAAERAFAFHQSHQLDISVLILPQGQDPADFVAAAGPEAGERFTELAAQAVPLVQYMIERSLIGRNLADVEARARAVRDGLAFVLPLEDHVRRSEYARFLAGRVGEPEMAVMLELQRVSAEAPGGSSAPERGDHGRKPPDEEVELEVLKLLVQQPGLTSDRLATLSADDFVKPTHRKAFELLREVWQVPNAPPTASSLVALAHERPGGDQLGRLVAIMAVEPPKVGGDADRAYVDRLFLRLQEFSLKRQADTVRKQLERLNPLKAPSDHEVLFERLMKLEWDRRQVRAAADAVGSTQ
jgi:DNA primase